MSTWNVPDGALSDQIFPALLFLEQSQERTGTPNDFVISAGDGAVQLIFTGTGFTYDAQDRLKSGDVDRCTIILNEVTSAEISGLDAPAKKIGGIRDINDFLDVLGAISFEGSGAVDIALGGKRDDTLRGGDGPDTLIGGNGDDRLLGGAGDDVLGKAQFLGLKDGGDDILDGGKGFDIAGFTLDVDLDLSLASTKFQDVGKFGSVKLMSIEGLIGDLGDDRLVGDKSGNLLWGEGGDDTLVGGGGDDTLDGDAGKNLLQGGDGRDTVSYGDFNDGVGGTVSLAKDGYQNSISGQDKLVGIEDLIGSDFTDRLTGDGKNNKLSGAGGNDTLDGAKGNDTLFGGLGDDLIQGGRGKDVLNGRAGADTLVGGDGADAFLFSANEEMGFDTIRGFENFFDKIDLGGLDADVAAAGNQAFTFRGEATAFNGALGELIWFKTGSTFQVQGDWNGDKVADFTIFVENPTQPTLSEFDFIL